MSDSKLVKFEFHGDELWATWRNGILWIPVKRVCECLGIDESSQRQRLLRSKWAVTAMVTVTGLDGKSYSMFCIHIDSLPMWLTTIQASLVKGKRVREKLELYQCQAAKALRDHFIGSQQTINPQMLRSIISEELLPYKQENADLKAIVYDSRSENMELKTTVQELRTIVQEIRDGQNATITPTELKLLSEKLADIARLRKEHGKEGALYITVMTQMFRWGVLKQCKLANIPSTAVPYAFNWLDGQLDEFKREERDKAKRERAEKKAKVAQEEAKAAKEKECQQKLDFTASAEAAAKRSN
ncbi:MAG: phage antirepressor N-terminal domain-containing protein [Patescibacteria group bacterium]